MHARGISARRIAAAVGEVNRSPRSRRGRMQRGTTSLCRPERMALDRARMAVDAWRRLTEAGSIGARRVGTRRAAGAGDEGCGMTLPKAAFEAGPGRAMTAAVKLACEHVWKLFGPAPERFLRAHPDAAPEQLAAAGLIGAVRDAGLADPRGRDLRHHGPVRLGQVDPGALHVAADRADRGAHPVRGRGPARGDAAAPDRDPPPQDGHGVPALRAAAAPHRARQRRLSARGAGRRAGDGASGARSR